MFIDRVKIHVKAGDGGNGAVSFLRMKYVPKGGPDGGNGGKGGHVILKVDPQLGTLLDLHYKPHIKAERGGHGSGNNRAGKRGENAVIRVPPGTMVYDESRTALGDLTEAGDELIIARGGRGGRGNASYATPTNRTPRKAQPGKPGEERNLLLELKLIADVGLVGLPNAGKSTLLSRVSAAHPEIADYPFTTLRPFLGIVQVALGTSFVMADIPGLIEGAAEGKGLGHRFLRHIERTRVLALLIDASEPEPEKVYQTLLAELENYNPDLLQRARLVVRSKSDLGGEHWKGEDLRISAVTGENVNLLTQRLAVMVAEVKKL